MHVELRTQEEINQNVQGTLWHTMTKGTIAGLRDLTREGKAVYWYVGDYHKGQGDKRQRCHFTVSYGSDKPIGDYIPDLLREQRAKAEVEKRIQMELEADFPHNKCLEILRAGHAQKHKELKREFRRIWWWGRQFPPLKLPLQI